MGSHLPDDPPLPDNGEGKGAPDLDTPSESLKSFKTRVDKLLTALDGSPAAHTRITEQKVTVAAYGTGFPEATGLSGAYDLVHTRLTELSKTLGEQLEAMGITVDLADRGYQNVDQEYAERLQAIQKRVEVSYRKPGTDPETGLPKDDRPDDTGSSSGQDGL
ncbi:hypothetical protein [Streptomyces sp. ITFR-16]|uniref:hypothetical protein n=1 Tax=Streptomyces sp. ITFR-16 TaxID=3075198 RepID=UPI00288A458A|nr:hypothetical protein [Streptomyces sp. ITFR-16]WNI24239.1 hypothetical protein RLT58_21050 [Streptomyces sp. ITFR-16]